MSTKRVQHIAVCTLTALGVTVGSVLLDAQRTGIHQTLAGLRWARQIATQAEGMVFKAREDGQRDPISWAVSYLSQGVEPRMIRVNRIQVQDSSTQPSETFSLDSDAGLFDYVRILMPENGTGIHIQIIQNYMGFLGAQTTLVSDFLVFGFFLILFALVFLLTGRYFGYADTRQARLQVSSWAAGAKSQLTLHGTHLRETVREAQRLAVGSGRARAHIRDLRGNIHSGLSELHKSRDFYKEGEMIATRAETLALNMAIEANRLGGDARRIADMATELHRKLQSLHAVNRRGYALVQWIERRIEPWSTDADLAFHDFEDIKDATQLLEKHIHSTTESLVGQAKLIQGLNRNLGAGETSAPPSMSKPSNPDPTPHPAASALPAPLPPIREQDTKPLFVRKLRAIKRKIRFRKSA